ncbi:K(+) efflux antiporter 4, partial [Zea mays]
GELRLIFFLSRKCRRFGLFSGFYRSTHPTWRIAGICYPQRHNQELSIAALLPPTTTFPLNTQESCYLPITYKPAYKLGCQTTTTTTTTTTKPFWARVEIQQKPQVKDSRLPNNPTTLGLFGNNVSQNHGFTILYFARVWRSWAPPKCCFFIWLVAQNRCWTVDRLAKGD